MEKALIRRRTAPFILLAAGIWFLAGCAGSPSGMGPAALPAQAALEMSPAGEEPAAQPTAPLPAVSVFTLDEEGNAYPGPAAAAGGAQGYPGAGGSALPTPRTVVRQEAPPTITPQPTEPIPSPVPTQSAEAGPTRTPPPTFTPPALPQTGADDHFWLRRPIPEGGVVWTDKYYPYGSTRGRTLRTHHGVEFNVSYNTPILAAADGVVVFAGSDAEALVGPEPNFYGNVVVVEHDFTLGSQPIYTLYGHLNAVEVVVGQRVTTLARLGLSGATGVADGPHLHFEVRIGQNTYGSTRNPILWLWPFPDRGALIGRVVFPGGAPAFEAPVSIRRIDGGESTVFSTTTYADNSVRSDDVWGENFAFDDVPAGYYEVSVKADGKKYSQEVWVFSRRTAQVEIVLGEN